MQLAVGVTYYQLLGKLLVNQRPDVAEEILSQIHKPIDIDLGKMDHYLSAFCSKHKITPSSITEVKHKSRAVELRRLFVASMLKVYHPGAFQCIEVLAIQRSGLVYKLSEVLHSNEGNMSKMIREVIMMVKVYDEFRDQVDSFVQQFYPACQRA